MRKTRETRKGIRNRQAYPRDTWHGKTAPDNETDENKNKTKAKLTETSNYERTAYIRRLVNETNQNTHHKRKSRNT